MTLFINNANDVILRNVAYNYDTSLPVANANFLVSICEENEFTVTGVTSHLTQPQITLSGDIGVEVGDRILVNRVVGTVSVNGFFTVVAVDPDNFTIDVAANTDVETYVSGGKVWKVIEEQALTTFDEALDQYLVTFEQDVLLTPGTQYMVFIQELELQVEIEFKEIAQIRTA